MNTPMSLTIHDAVRTSGISRTAIYEALKQGRLTAVKCGKRTLIPYESLTDYLASLPVYKARA
jgi:excisionase family DNA binding protein